MPSSELRNKDFLVLLTRLFLGYVFFSAGICKLTHGNFGQLIGPPWLEERLLQYGLGLFAQVVAVCQVICGLLLFSQRFSTLGAVMLVPMNISILAVTVSQNWTGTPYVNAVFLLLNLLLLMYEKDRFHFLFSAEPTQFQRTLPLDILRRGKLPWVILAAGFLTLVVAFFQVIWAVNALGLLTFGLAGAVVVLSRLLSRLEKAIVLLAIANMFLMTLGFISVMLSGLVLNTGTILILLLTNIWLRSKASTHQSLEVSA